MRSTNKMQLRVYRGAIRISFVLVVSFTTARMTASNPEIPWRNLVVHGPFEVGDKDLISASAQELSLGESEAPLNPGLAPLGVDGDANEGPGPQSPKAVVSFDAIASLNNVDPGIAVGTSYVLVSDAVNGIAVYDKTGKLIPAKSGQSNFANPFSIGSLFSKVKADIDPTLNMPSHLPTDFPREIEGYGDVRIMFDAYRKCFWIYAQAKNELHGFTTDDKIVHYPNIKVARRNKAAVAVSKTEDPRDGFYTYWWNETIHNGECNKFKGCSDPVFKTSGEGADYPSIGISPKYFIATAGVNRRDPTFITDTLAKAKLWNDKCETGFKEHGQKFDSCGPFYGHLMVVDADNMSHGLPFPTGGSKQEEFMSRSYGLFIDAQNYVTDRSEDGDFAHDMSRGVRPVVMHGPKPKVSSPNIVESADAYFTTTFIDRSAKEPVHYLTLWSLLGGYLFPTLYRIHPITFDANWHEVMINASYRDGKLYATFQQPVVWKSLGGNSLWSIRVLRINTLNAITEIDRTFGGRNKFDDKPTARFEYQLPGIEANKEGDMVLVYVRSSSGLPQEVRFSLWDHDETDIRPSRLLRSEGENDNPWCDTAGIAVDPADDEAIWVAHIFTTNKGSRRIAVGKILGKKISTK